jgi:hypothetical protein
MDKDYEVRINFLDLAYMPQKMKKTALRWAVNGGKRHAGQQEDLIPRGHGV